MAGLGGLGGPVGILPFNFVVVPFWNECLVSNVPLCWCIVSESRKEARASFLKDFEAEHFP